MYLCNEGGVRNDTSKQLTSKSIREFTSIGYDYIIPSLTNIDDIHDVGIAWINGYVSESDALGDVPYFGTHYIMFFFKQGQMAINDGKHLVRVYYNGKWGNWS